MTKLSLDAWASCLEPVSAVSPVGVDARHEPEHELLRREVAKLSAVESGAPDWLLVSSVGRELLTNKSKDLLVAVYVACALAVQEPIVGAAQGALLLTSLCTRFGSQMFPLRARAQVAALAWYVDWLAAQLDLSAVAPQPALSVLRAKLHELREAATLVIGQSTPSFGAVLRSCERLERSALVVPAATPTATPAAQPNGEAAPLPAPRITDALVRSDALPGTSAEPTSRSGVLAPSSAIPPVPVQTPIAPPEQPRVTPITLPPAADTRVGEEESVRYVFGAPPEALPQLHAYVVRAGALLVELARSRFAVDRTDARSYRWLRTGLWLRWERAPEPNRRGRIELDGPSPARQLALSRAVKAALWDDVLGLSEQLLVKHPLWLDANRSTALALAKLGDGYAAAHDHVLRDTQALLARLPELAKLVFSDGTPLASADTARWLALSTKSHAEAHEIGARLAQRSTTALF